MLGKSDGAVLVVGGEVGVVVDGAAEVGVAVVGFTVDGATEVGAGVTEHPAVLLTSATTASLHCPLISRFDTQKNAPPLHENCPPLVVLRSAMTWTASAALAFEPVPPQSEMQKPKTTYSTRHELEMRSWLVIWFQWSLKYCLGVKLTLLGSALNMSFANDANMTAALIDPRPVPSTPSDTGLVTPL